MKTIEAGALSVAYLESGPADGPVAILLHGFPYDVHAFDAVAERLSGQGWRCVVPYLRGYGATRFLSSDTLRSGQQAALGNDLLAFMDALGIERAVLGGYDWGGRAACIVAALWPERVVGLVSCNGGYNIQDIAGAKHPADPDAEFRYWYQYYFHTERGVEGLSRNRRELTQFIWKLWSPTWNFDQAMFDQSAEAFDNPDFVDVVIHSYRHRFGVAAGDGDLDALEQRLADQPDITVPTVVLDGADDGVHPLQSDDKGARHFTGRYRRAIVPGVGHNFPQEAPEVFADAVVEVGRG
ncbi:alpha/beta hydrolase [Tianweitania sp. BSSL-BM11]|uniref:Alpha/beta hydrolase n=1 Tax=Tianweitania aestuarii TaxID=2814886 RepID=A0ABS5RV90_9HYPH|nr:alpha/beta hydrolase [Tianweitania aestuarii]MBS9720892.1 alpha/beta hydrolase [Tianweitania aestuarii]